MYTQEENLTMNRASVIYFSGYDPEKASDYRYKQDVK